MAQVKMWRVYSRYGFTLERVLCDRITEKSVYIKGRRQNRVGDGCRYFESFGEAFEFSAHMLENKLETARQRLNACQGDLERLCDMTAESVPTSTTR